MERYAKLTGTVTIARNSLPYLGSSRAKERSTKSQSETNLLFPSNRAHFTRSEVPDSAKLPLIPGPAENPEISNPQSLRIALLGLPNAGKSSLMNALIKFPIAAVSPKSHTTRELVQGIATTGNFQLIVDDLPGLIAVRNSEEIRRFVADAWTTSEICDVKLLVVDVTRRVDPSLVKVLRSIGNFSNVVLALNKVDCLEPNSAALRLKRAELEALSPDGSRFARVFFVSAKRGNGVDRLAEYLRSRAVDRAWLFDGGCRTSLSRVDQVQQQTRSLIYAWFNGDLPYRLQPSVVGWDERLDGSLAVEQELRVKDTVVARMVLGVRNRLVRNLEEKLGERLTKIWGVTVTMRVVVRAEKARESRRDRQEKAKIGLHSCDFRL